MMTKRIKLRTLLFGGFITLLFLILVGRIYWVQVVKGAEWYERAKDRWSASEQLAAKRGTITDRDGNVLAMDTLAYTVAVNPSRIDKLGIEDEVVKGLNLILGKNENELRAIITAKRDNGELFTQREVRPEGWKIEKAVADQIKELRTELSEKTGETDVGITLIDDLKRYYPRNTLASQLLGYISKEGEARYGLESYFNEQLSGEDGYIKYEKDGKRVQLATGEVDFKPAIDGDNIKLTIDGDIQHYAQEALADIVDNYSPKSATIIVADPNTMEILAMANVPDYNPNEYSKSPYENFNNHAIMSLYEPGSTFKIVTLAAAVEEGLFNPEETFKSGEIKVPGATIRDIKRGGWGQISFLDGIIYSSNVSFVILGYQRLGETKLREYITNFGFGQKSGIELGNELAGSIRFQFPSEVATASFGQGVSVTMIQQVAAVAAVANGGTLYKPQLVKEIYDPATKTTTVNEPKAVRRVISEETSRKVGEYLEQVVSNQEYGTGRRAYLEGYRIAGKTGTAQKWTNKGWSDDKFVTSFIGYAPVEDPKVVVYVLVDEPNDPLVGGGIVAAPAFKEVVAKSLRKLGVAPSTTESGANTSKKEAMVKVPDMKDLKVLQARAELTVRNLELELIGNGGTVLQQVPAAGALVSPGQRIYLITEQRDKLKVPDLTGLSLRDALEISSVLGVRLIANGEGYVAVQKESEENGERTLHVTLVHPDDMEAAVAAAKEAKEAEGAEADNAAAEEDDAGEELPPASE